MNEHEWEVFLRNSDARTDRYGELIDKFGEEPDGERLIEEGMGWNLDAPAWHDEIEPPDESWRGKAEEPEEEPPPDPSREGIDWVRNERGEICHPLYLRAQKLSHRLIDETRGLRDEAEPDPTPAQEAIHEMCFQVHCVAAKLAGALSGVARDSWSESGFVIACLKRIQPILAAAFDALEPVEKNAYLPKTLTDHVRTELFAIRADIIVTMNRFRKRR